MIPKTTRYTTGYIIEFKSIGQAEDIQEACTHALNQIHDNEYSAAVHNTGVPSDQVRSLAIILQGKEILVGETGSGKRVTSLDEDSSVMNRHKIRELLPENSLSVNLK